jgi:hypothetical protein
MERAASQIRDGEIEALERISEYATADLACIVEIERTRAKIGGSDEIGSVSLRMTTIFRREDDAWRITHRHADPTSTPRTFESILELSAAAAWHPKSTLSIEAVAAGPCHSDSDAICTQSLDLVWPPELVDPVKPTADAPQRSDLLGGEGPWLQRQQPQLADAPGRITTANRCGPWA